MTTGKRKLRQNTEAADDETVEPEDETTVEGRMTEPTPAQTAVEAAVVANAPDSVAEAGESVPKTVTKEMPIDAKTDDDAHDELAPLLDTAETEGSSKEDDGHEEAAPATEPIESMPVEPAAELAVPATVPDNVADPEDEASAPEAVAKEVQPDAKTDDDANEGTASVAEEVHVIDSDKKEEEDAHEKTVTVTEPTEVASKTELTEREPI